MLGFLFKTKERRNTEVNLTPIEDQNVAAIAYLEQASSIAAMGNKQVGIGLKTDRTNYEAGSTVKGKVYVKVAANSNDPVTGIHLVLDGEERVFVSVAETHEVSRDDPTGPHELQQGAPKRRKKDDNMVKSFAKLIAFNVPIALFPKALARGEYEYPFEWELPQNLPPSMFVASQGRTAGVVQYQLTAYYTTGKPTTPNIKVPLYLPHQSATQKIQILATPTPLQNIKSIEEEDEFTISSCYCFPKGKVHLGFHLDRGIVAPGSRVQVNIRGANFSEIPVSQLEVTLLEHIKWTAQNRSLERTSTLAREIIATSDLSQWQGRTSSNFSQNEALLTEPLPLRLWVPSLAKISYRGKLMEVTHTLKVRAVTMWYASSPTLESSIKVGIVGDDANYIPETPVIMASTGIASVVASGAPSLDTPMAEAEAVILPDDWRGQSADVIFIPPTMVMSEDDNMIAMPPSVVPTAPDETLMHSAFGSDGFEDMRQSDYNDNGIEPCDFSQLQAFLANLRNLEDLPDLLPRNPSVLARVRRVTPRQYVSLVCHPESASIMRPGRKADKKRAEDICRGRVLAAVMGESFQCRHVLACLWGCPEEYRLEILREVAPLASDWTTQRGTIERELEPEEADYARTVLQWS